MQSGRFLAWLALFEAIKHFSSLCLIFTTASPLLANQTKLISSPSPSPSPSSPPPTKWKSQQWRYNGSGVTHNFYSQFSRCKKKILSHFKFSLRNLDERNDPEIQARLFSSVLHSLTSSFLTLSLSLLLRPDRRLSSKDEQQLWERHCARNSCLHFHQSALI